MGAEADPAATPLFFKTVILKKITIDRAHGHTLFRLVSDDNPQDTLLLAESCFPAKLLEFAKALANLSQGNQNDSDFLKNIQSCHDEFRASYPNGREEMGHIFAKFTPQTDSLLNDKLDHLLENNKVFGWPLLQQWISDRLCASNSKSQDNANPSQQGKQGNGYTIRHSSRTQAPAGTAAANPGKQHTPMNQDTGRSGLRFTDRQAGWEALHAQTIF